MHSNHQHSLQSSALELKYAHSSHLLDIIAKDEDIRRLRFDIHILEDDNDELRELLQQEEDRSESFEKLVHANLERAEAAEVHLRDMEVDLQDREQELQALLAERQAFQHSSEDATAALTEKLALTRELSILKPELEHLRAQGASAEAIMTEKLALQRQLSTIQCELENAKREAKRALAKRRNTGVEIAQEEQVEDLKRQLAKERRARQRAEEAVETSHGDMQSVDLRKQLVQERKARQKAEEQLEAAQDATQVEDVRKELLSEKKAKAKLEESLEALQVEIEREKKAAARAAKRADGNAEADDQAEELRQELKKEQKERIRVEKAAKQAADEFEAQRVTLDEKLNQFRAKLRTTKEKLKETESQLAAAQVATTVPASKTAKPLSKANQKKRNVEQMDADATTLGTPGDGPAAKRGRNATAGVGNKSTFSITPFLSKTVSVIQEETEDSERGPAAAEDEASPAAKKSKQPLSQLSASTTNLPAKKPASQRKPKVPMLAMVTEENEDAGQENTSAKPQTLKVKTKTADGPDGSADGAKKQKAKQRKSLADFPNFVAEAEAEKKKKNRKLGGLGKTLFDEEEESAAPSKALPGRSIFGSKGLGIFGAGKKSGGIGASLLGGMARPGSALLTAADGSGFQFSPLKRSRKNLDDTLRVL